MGRGMLIALVLAGSLSTHPARVGSPLPYMIKDIWPGSGSSYPSNLLATGDTVLFYASDGAHGQELWRTDGTAAGTYMVREIRPGAEGVTFEAAVAANTRIFFQADDGNTGDELWVSDGTFAGTYLVKDIWPGPDSSEPSNLFVINFSMSAWGQNVAFSANDGTNGRELWVSDGTAEGTYRVRDLQPGASSSYPQWITEFNGMLLFSADNGVSGRELWRSDGTHGGTALVKDIYPGSADSNPTWLVSLGSVALFSAYDGPAPDGLPNTELWRTNGFASGTARIADIHPTSSSSPAELTAYKGKAYFSAYDADDDQELWVSNGAGAYRLKNINPTGSSGPQFFHAAGAYLFFEAFHPDSGWENWVTDGTEVGTHIVKDINQGLGSGIWGGAFECAGQFFLPADDGMHGKELWISDLTEEGTYLLFDLLPGPDNSYPAPMGCLGGRLIFAARDGITGRELWALDLEMQPIPAATHLTITISAILILGAGILLIRRRGLNRVGASGPRALISSTQEV